MTFKKQHTHFGVEKPVKLDSFCGLGYAWCRVGGVTVQSCMHPERGYLRSSISSYREIDFENEEN